MISVFFGIPRRCNTKFNEKNATNMTHRTDGKFPVVLGTQKMTIFQRAGQSRTITELQNLEMQPSLGLQPQKKKVFLQDPAVSCPSNLAGGGALLGCGVRAVHIVVHHRPHGVVRLPCLLRRLGGHRGWEGCKGGNAIPRPGGSQQTGVMAEMRVKIPGDKN